MKVANKSSADIAVDGSALIKELGMKPGPQFGKALTAIKDQILDGKLANDHDQLLTVCFVKILCRKCELNADFKG